MRSILIGAALSALCAACSVSFEDSDPSSEPEVTEMSYLPTGLIAKTLPEISEALDAGEISAVDLVGAYQARIETIDRAGPTLQAVLALNPNALSDAVPGHRPCSS